MTQPTSDHSWTRRLKLRHLEVLLALEKTGTVTAAAKSMHISQPALSHWISDMEDLVGTPLFVRGRMLSLTEAGAALCRYARRVMGDTARTGEEIEAVKSGVAGRLHVGTILSATPVLLPKAIAKLQRDAPNVHIELIEGLISPLIERVKRREVDLIIGPLDLRGMRADLCMERLITDTFSVVVRPGHPLTRMRAVRWSDTVAHPWIMPPLTAQSRVTLEQAFADAGITAPKPAVETGSLVALSALLQQRDYVATLATSVARMYEQLKLLSIVAMPERLEFGPIGMLWSGDSPSIILPVLQQLLREEAKRQSTAL